jgi:cytochrome P450
MKAWLFRVLTWLFRVLTKPSVLRPLSGLLRRFFPIVVVGKFAIVSRYLDVVEVLGRDSDFTISQINGPKLVEIDGPFLLGLDRGPQYEREREMMREVLRSSDMPRITQIVREEARRQIQAATPAGRIDVVNGYARFVALRLVSRYFGVTFQDQQQMGGWLRDIFWAVFQNLANDPSIMPRAVQSDLQLRARLETIIASRKGSPSPRPTDVVGRMVALQGPARPWLDDATIRRNLTGMIVGTVDFTSTFFTYSLTELLKRRRLFALARNAALAGDRETVRRYIYEAGRFNPAAPLLARHANVEATVAAGTPRQKTIPAGNTVVLGNISAMFDPDGFDDPESFDIDHEPGRLHFSYGLHTCAGSQINAVVLPELALALLRLSNLRLAPNNAGVIQFEGPFPNRLFLDFG